MEAENIVDKKELKGLPIWACILLFIVVYFAVYSGVFCVYVVV